jgi:uncharacterized membrane protein
MKNIKFTFLFMLLLVFSFQGKLDAQTTVFDQEIYWTWPTSGNDYGGYGFYWWHRNEGVVNINYGSMSSTDWTSPNNFYDGEFVMRFEVLDQPTNEDFYVQFGIWQDKDKGGAHPETVAGRHYVSGGNGSAFEASLGSPNSWWNKEPGDKVDFSRPEDFYRIGIVLWNADPLCIPMGHDWNTSGCPEFEANFFPMRARVTVIAYAGTSTPTYQANFKVTDGTNNLSGANISINNQNITTSSGGDASISLKNGSYPYTVTKSGYFQKSGTVNISGSNVTENVTLTPAYQVTFNVKDDNSAAIEGANVSIDGKNLQTNSSGIATISLANGTYSYQVTKSGFFTSNGNITISGSNYTENVTLSTETYNLYFLVKDVADNAIEGANISIAGFDPVTTNESGFGTFPLPNGNYNYTVSKSGYTNATGSVTVSGANTEKLVILSETSYTVSFNVKDEGGNNLESATISINGNDLQTNTDGNASIDLVNGSYSYSVNKAGYIEATGTVNVSGSAVTENVLLEELKWTVTFIVKDESSTALEGATISVNGSDLITNSSGEASIDLPDGDYPWSVTLSEFGTENGTFSVSGSTVTQNVTLTKTSYLLSFKVIDTDTNPIEGASIAVNGTSLSTDASGEASIEVVNGNYPYTVSKDGYNDVSATATVSGAAVTENVTLNVASYAVNFTVLDAGFNPVENALISVNGSELNTDANGQASISLVDGSYNYTVTKENYEQVSASLTVAGSDVEEGVTLTEQTYLITFKVVDQDAGALESASISINGSDLTTGSNGEATVELANGDYDYTVTLAGFEPLNGSLSVAGADLTENVSLTEISYLVTFIITDENTNALEGAAISIDGNDLTSDSNGEAGISLPNGEYSYTVNLEDYEEASGSVTVNGADVSEAVTLEIIISNREINADNIRIYPNPGAEIITLESNASFKPNTRFYVYSTSGVRVYSHVNESEIERLSIDLSTMEKGIYFLNIQSEGSALTQKIVIK